MKQLVIVASMVFLGAFMVTTLWRTTHRVAPPITAPAPWEKLLKSPENPNGATLEQLKSEAVVSQKTDWDLANRPTPPPAPRLWELAKDPIKNPPQHK
jgi:hypothetical protein